MIRFHLFKTSPFFFLACQYPRLFMLHHKSPHRPTIVRKSGVKSPKITSYFYPLEVIKTNILNIISRMLHKSNQPFLFSLDIQMFWLNAISSFIIRSKIVPGSNTWFSFQHSHSYCFLIQFSHQLMMMHFSNWGDWNRYPGPLSGLGW